MPSAFLFPAMQTLLRKLCRRLFRHDPLAILQARGLSVGRNFFMQDDCTIDAWHCCHIRIGDEVTLGPRVTILAHDASMKRALGMVRLGKVNIGNRVFIGTGSIVLPGVTIGDDVVIGAGSVVSQNIPANSLAVGNPARVVGTCEEYLARQKALMASSPCFDETYTARGGVTAARQEEMNTRMGDGSGFIV
jgi:maltose O-acetyltransferase